ncbi:hypothetical protein EDB81DRAFT_499102 [Dactylonectria macrodidyma]|uniref:Uncharacterized protein n=1 Tax=Dactylonectria macrodidyma TaxID=307937 RepID=A0A9P9J0G4_9HYPO|nr:hypothetical protein EDB81DRAFT_499102 [Dactylonectria macrodidyma]
MPRRILSDAEMHLLTPLVRTTPHHPEGEGLASLGETCQTFVSLSYSRFPHVRRDLNVEKNPESSGLDLGVHVKMEEIIAVSTGSAPDPVLLFLLGLRHRECIPEFLFLFLLVFLRPAPSTPLVALSDVTAARLGERIRLWRVSRGPFPSPHPAESGPKTDMMGGIGVVQRLGEDRSAPLDETETPHCPVARLGLGRARHRCVTEA